MRRRAGAVAALGLALALSAGAGELVSGPMVGHTTDKSVRIWARARSETDMVVLLAKSEDLARPLKSAPVKTLAANDFTGVAELKGLEPAARYYYNVLLGGKAQLAGPLPSFRTFPAAGRPAKVRVMFGGGIRFQVEPKQVIWEEMLKLAPLAMVEMGDNIYADNYITGEHLKLAELGGNEKYLKKSKGGARYVHTKADHRSERVYYRIQQSLPPYRRFIGRVPIYAVWDDHDAFGEGGARGRPPLTAGQKLAVKVFAENFAHPYYGGGAKAPGTWCHFSIADCDFFLLDARTYRGVVEDKSRKHQRRFMGHAEEKWLKQGLLRSKATFKFIVCGSPWNNQSKAEGRRTTAENYYGRHGDTLASFKWHRDELLKYIIARKIPGVILLSGDRHRADTAKVWAKGLPGHIFYDLNNCNIASRTMKAAFKPGEEGLLWSWSGRCFGVLDIDTTSKPPRVTYSLWGSRRGRPPITKKHEFVLHATDFLPELVK